MGRDGKVLEDSNNVLKFFQIFPNIQNSFINLVRRKTDQISQAYDWCAPKSKNWKSYKSKIHKFECGKEAKNSKWFLKITNGEECKVFLALLVYILSDYRPRTLKLGRHKQIVCEQHVD